MQLNTSFLKLFKNPIFLVLISLILYGVFAYDLVRSDFTKLFIIYCILFVCFYKLTQNNKHNLKLLTWIAFGFRGVFIIAIPNLSQDFYRFIWDGRIILEGFNPYLFTVESFLSIGEYPVVQAQELYSEMGKLNASHYSNYPPINQLCFIIAGFFAGKSILGSAVVIRILIIAADFGTLYYGKKLLAKLNLPIHNIFWYILNPFIIIELTGNLHFEGVMIFFLIWSLYLLYTKKWIYAAIVFALSVSVKLIPLIFLPLFYQWFVIKKKGSKIDFSGLKKLVGFYSIIGITILLLFAPFYSSQFVSNYMESISLWFQKFEFNASIYYILRAIGYYFSGYNLIAYIGTIIPVFVILYVLYLTFFKLHKNIANLITVMFFALSFYYFTTTTVHPWYIATLLILSIFTNYKFPLVWSFVIILSYLTYSNSENQENLWIISLEYLIVYGFLIYEVSNKKYKSNVLAQFK